MEPGRAARSLHGVGGEARHERVEGAGADSRRGHRSDGGTAVVRTARVPRPGRDSGAIAEGEGAAGVKRRVLLIVAGVVTLFALYVAVTFGQVWYASHQDDARHAEAIVVLGAAQFNGKPSKVLAARLDHAADLYKRGLAPLIVVTGGKQPGDNFTEAQASANYLAQHGVPGA